LVPFSGTIDLGLLIGVAFWGFGTPILGRSTHHDEPGRIAVLPYTWTFFTLPHDKHVSMFFQSWRSYILLPIDACRLSVAPLRALQPKPSSVQCAKLSKARAQIYAGALLQYHFIYSDFIRWLSGEYANRHGAWSQDFATMVQTLKRLLSSDCPVPADYPRAFRICT
jgi:hypothetical protein